MKDSNQTLTFLSSLYSTYSPYSRIFRQMHCVKWKWQPFTWTPGNSSLKVLFAPSSKSKNTCDGWRLTVADCLIWRSIFLYVDFVRFGVRISWVWCKIWFGNFRCNSIDKEQSIESFLHVVGASWLWTTNDMHLWVACKYITRPIPLSGARNAALNCSVFRVILLAKPN